MVNNFQEKVNGYRKLGGAEEFLRNRPPSSLMTTRAIEFGNPNMMEMIEINAATRTVNNDCIREIQPNKTDTLEKIILRQNSSINRPTRPGKNDVRKNSEPCFSSNEMLEYRRNNSEDCLSTNKNVS